MLHRIVRVEPASGYKLLITFDDGGAGLYDCAPLIGAGGVFRPLADERVFRSVTIGRRGRFIEWKSIDVDLCADALWLDTRETQTTG